jgi:hypothetical protein
MKPLELVLHLSKSDMRVHALQWRRLTALGSPVLAALALANAIRQRNFIRALCS